MVSNLSDTADSSADEDSLDSIGEEDSPLLPRHATDGDQVESSHGGTGLSAFLKKRTSTLISTVRRILPKDRLNWPQTTRALDHSTTGNRRRLIFQVIFLALWLLVDLSLIRQSWFLSSLSEPGLFPQPTQPEWLHCVESFWLKDDGCGLDGQDCSQYRNVSLAFRCPSHCGTSTGLLNPRVVGGQVANYQPLVVGGGGDSGDQQGKRYRPDSFICQSAVHAGIISARWGGCGVMKMLEGTNEFIGSEANGIQSIGFPAPFPTSFIFLDSVRSSACHDLWLHIILLNVLFSTIFTIALGPSPKMFFWVLCVVGYWTVVVASEPSSLPPSWSNATGIFLPFLFVCYWLWNVSWSHTLETITSLDKVWVYLGPWWFGVLMNLTFGWVPIDRLTPHDLHQRPGALFALSIVITLTTVLICYQAWCLKKENRFGKLGLPYACLGMVLVLFLFVPQHSVRIHHYLIGIFLSPLASARTSLSGVLQGFLLGMIQNGIARWSFASLLERSSDVFGDGCHSGDLMPEFDLANSVLINQDLKISWMDSYGTDGHGWVGVMVNDILRFIIPTIQHSLIIHNFQQNLTTSGLNLASSPTATLDRVFFRLAFFDEDNLDSLRRVGEYTGPITFFVHNQTWLGPIPVV